MIEPGPAASSPTPRRRHWQSSGTVGLRLAPVVLLACARAHATTTPDTRPEDAPAAYNQLAETRFQRQDLAGAEVAYVRSLELVESDHGISSPLLVEPLSGLARIHVARGQYAHAIDLLRRAIVVLRRNGGLFTLEQLPMLDQLVANYGLIGDTFSVVGALQYQLAIAERNFGVADSRNVEPVKRLAQLHESLGEYAHSRTMYERMREIGRGESGHGNPIVVTALIGIGRSHRKQYVEAPKSVQQHYVRDPVTGNHYQIMSLEPYQSPQPHRGGVKATAEALALLRQADQPPPQLLAETLIEMGDWNVVLQKPDAALSYYAEACGIYAESLAEELNPLAAPRLVFYRAPKASRRRGELPPELIETQHAGFRVTVDADGETGNIVLESSTTSNRRSELLRRSVEFARYSPRFQSCKPVSTDAVIFDGHWEALIGETGDSGTTPENPD